MYWFKQATANINLAFQLKLSSGVVSIADTVTAIIIKPDGTLHAGYTAPTITEPNADGTYVLSFTTALAVAAFTEEDTSSPYWVSINGVAANVVQSAPMPVWIVTKLPREMAKPSEILVDVAHPVDGELITTDLDATMSSRAAPADILSDVAHKVDGELITTNLDGTISSTKDIIRSGMEG